MKRRPALTLLCIFCFISGANAQLIIIEHHFKKDTAYIKEYYRRHIVFRAYESTKFTEFKLIDHHDQLIYKPNAHNNVGIGVNYRFICVNLGVYIPFISKDRATYGKTTDIDLQLHFYAHRFVIDVYGGFYQGYFLSNTGASIINAPEQVLLRPDIKTRNESVVVQYVYNDKQFSYNAPFYQNERQKKSAGSLLLGGGIYHFDARADSPLVPANITYTDFIQNSRFNVLSTNAACATLGYAYTLVLKHYFFLSGSLSGGAGVNVSTLSDTYLGHTDEKIGPEFQLNANFSAGYNSDVFFAGITYVRLVTENTEAEPQAWLQVSSGNFRVTVAKRFRLKKSLIPKSDLIKIE